MKLVAMLMLAGAVAAVRAQAPEAPMPAAPTAPAKPTFALPPASYAPPGKDASAMAPRDNGDVCHAAPEGNYTRANQMVPESLKGATQSYSQEIAHQVFGEWDHAMPRMARNAWQRGRFVAVRLAIMPDGTHDTPAVTMSSGNLNYDNLALVAVRSHPTFEPPPAGLKHPLVLCLHFGYNMTLDEMDPTRYERWQDQPRSTAAKPQ